VTTLFAPVADFLPAAMVIDEPRSRFVVLSRGALWAVSLGGQISWLAGVPGVFTNVMLDGEASVARFSFPGGLAVDAAGNVFVADLEIVSGGQFQPPTYRGAIRQFSPGFTDLRHPTQSYPGTVRTLTLSPAFIPYGSGGSGFISDGVLKQPTGLAWVGNSLAVTDSGRHTVRLIR
jgi:hypothetical protein